MAANVLSFPDPDLTGLLSASPRHMRLRAVQRALDAADSVERTLERFPDGSPSLERELLKRLRVVSDAARKFLEEEG